ncbi:hypothetical protein CDAR_586151 [Caerostris darwini]|uniref:Uncharacterized protein n=1 Tax=Caerostris darwini TaxID=1538125 RepID=A0AAV4UY12_9ARAC|nr:hypothetical protein CDAR_586151 [Caerostris darwini]
MDSFQIRRKKGLNDFLLESRSRQEASCQQWRRSQPKYGFMEAASKRWGLLSCHVDASFMSPGTLWEKNTCKTYGFMEAAGTRWGLLSCHVDVSFMSPGTVWKKNTCRT